MRTAHIARLGLASLLATLAVAPQAARADDYYDVSANAIGPRPVSFDMFYQELSPYGSWVQCEPYGWIWMPSSVDASWQPYTTGYWGYSAQYGYSWFADEVWGWAPFHYGNWIYAPSYGWAWVPGYSWSAAWVSWRYGAGYVAWAPLPPRYYGGGYGGYYGNGYAYGYNNYGYGYGNGYGNNRGNNGHHDNRSPQPDVRNDVATTIDPKHYVVVPEGSFQDTQVTSVMRRDVASSSEFNNVKQVPSLPTLTRRNAPPAGAAGGNQAINGRVDSPGSRDIARVDHGDIGATRTLDNSRALESSQTHAPDLASSNRVREMGRSDEIRSSNLPRLAPTPRLPQVGATSGNQAMPRQPSYFDQSRQDYSNQQRPSQSVVQPRVSPTNQSTNNQPRIMPISPRSAPSYQPRSAPMPRTNMPVMRAAPAPHPTFRAAPSSGGRMHMPSGRPRGR